MDQLATGSEEKLLEQMGVANIDQAIMKWEKMKIQNEELTEHKDGLVELIKRVQQVEQVDSLPQLIVKLKEERARALMERKESEKKEKLLRGRIKQLEAEVKKIREPGGDDGNKGSISKWLSAQRESSKERFARGDEAAQKNVAEKDKDWSDNSECESVHSFASSGKKMDHSVMRRRAASKLPRMDKYDGTKEDWDRYYDGFMVRFDCLDDDMAIAMVAETVTGKAADTFRDMPRKVKQSGLSQVMKWMKKRLSEETPFEEIENEKKLRNIEAEGQKISRVCDELERLTRKLEKDKNTREKMRRNNLVLIYEGRHQHEKLLEKYAKGDSYEKMKEKLVQMEYLQEQMDVLRVDEVDVIHGNLHDVVYDEESGADVILGKKTEVICDRRNRRDVIHGDETDVIYSRSNGQDVIHGEKTDVICNRCFKQGHLKKDCLEKMESGGGEWKRCDHCGRQGHSKDNCYHLKGFPIRHQFNENAAEIQGPNGRVLRILGEDVGVIRRIQGKGEEDTLVKTKELRDVEHSGYGFRIRQQHAQDMESGRRMGRSDSRDTDRTRRGGGEARDGDASCWKERGDVREKEEIKKKQRQKS